MPTDPNKKIRVLNIIYSLTAGGAERIVTDYAKNMNKTRFDVYVCALTSGGFFEEELNAAKIPYYILYKKKHFDLSIFLKLKNIIQRHKFDIIHIHGFPANFYGTFAGKLSNIKVIIRTEHNIENRNGISNLVRCIFRDILGCFHNHIICVADNVRISHQKFKILSKKKHITIYNGVENNLKFADKKNTNYFKEFHITNDTPVVGIIGSLTDQKGHEVFFDALARIPKNQYGFKAIVVGGGPRLYRLKQLVREYKLDESVQFTGVRKDVKELLHFFDFVCLSSHWEGFPMVILEAMAARKPVVSTLVGGVGEAVVDRHTGLLVPPKDPDKLAEAIKTMIDNPKLRIKMGLNGYKRYKKLFSLDRFIKNTEYLYEMLYYKNIEKN